MKDIAEEFGFNDESHFSNYFKKSVNTDLQEIKVKDKVEFVVFEKSFKF